jgi:predicted hotdog family 3-hydroxylacyl-ACP dehydratase
MVCIDTLLSASATRGEASVRLGRDSILLHDDALTEAGYVELAAQTAGAMKSFMERKRGVPAKEGFLAAIRDFSCFAQAKRGDFLRVTVTLAAEIAGVNLIEAAIRRENDGEAPVLLAGGKLKLFVPGSYSDSK